MTNTKWLLSRKITAPSTQRIEWFRLYLALLQLSAWSDYSNPLNYKIVWSLLHSIECRKVGWSKNGSNQRYSFPSESGRRFTSRNSTRSTSSTVSKLAPSKFLWSAFLNSWGSTRPKNNLHYCTNRDFQLFFLSHTNGKFAVSVVSARRYFARWVDSYNLLFNIFYTDASIQMMSNRLFIEESLVFNWQYNSRNYKIFKYTQPYFMFKDFTHGAFVHSAVFSIFLQNIDLGIIVDMNNHKIFRGYLQRYSLYMVGLVPVNYSPWKVSYPIPAFSDSQLSQFYFIKWLFFIRGRAENHRYLNLAELWDSNKI